MIDNAGSYRADMQNIGIVGAGTMGGGIGLLAAVHGHDVRLFDTQSGAAEGMVHEIANRLHRWEDSGRIATDDARAAMDRLDSVESMDGLAGSDLVIEAASEDLELKRTVFSGLEQILDEKTILASNTSSLSITAISEALRRPDRLVGMHFFNPAPVMELVEIVSGERTSPDVAATCFDLATSWGKHPVHCRSSPGFIGNFVNRPFYLEALRIREEGVADEPTIDEVLVRAGGFRMGPFELMDLVGVDVNLAVSDAVWKALDRDQRFEPSGIQRTLVKQGKLGRKTGAGFYSYGPGPPARHHRTVPPGESASRIRVGPSPGGLGALVERARASGIVVESGAELDGIEVAEVRLVLSDGYTAMEHTMGSAIPAVLVDWARDLSGTSSLGVASSVAPALSAAAGFLHQLGIETIHLNDRSGLVVGRVVSSIINVAAEALHNNVASGEDIDTAMLLGFNYPEGPLAWGRRLGSTTISALLEQMGRHVNDGRYYPTEGLERALATPT